MLGTVVSSDGTRSSKHSTRSSLLFSFRHYATTLVDTPDFRARKTRQDFRLALEMKHIVRKTESSHFLRMPAVA